jgi:hypothetical protein
MNNCEKEIENIRLKLYEETKNLTQEERVAMINEKAKKIASQFNFEIVSHS